MANNKSKAPYKRILISNLIRQQLFTAFYFARHLFYKKNQGSCHTFDSQTLRRCTNPVDLKLASCSPYNITVNHTNTVCLKSHPRFNIEITEPVSGQQCVDSTKKCIVKYAKFPAHCIRDVYGGLSDPLVFENF